MNQKTKLQTINHDPSKQRLRVWLRLLKVQRQIEATLRDQLKAEFNTTLPRFDVMAALDHHRDGLRMSELSSFLKVSNGNVTGIIDRLVQEGSVVRVPVEGDRRAMVVQLNEQGLKEFQTMAKSHERWLSDLLNDLDAEDADILINMFDRLIDTIGEDQ